MHAKDLVKENNRKREMLSEENRKDYEEMLVYIRMSNKSEEDTEEILMELLDHLLEAQEEGKTSKDIFGQDLKSYSKELVKELPKEKKKEQIIFLVYLGLNLVGTVGMFLGFISIAMYQFFDLGTETFQFHLGTGITVLIIDLVLLALFVYVIILWINGSLFKKKQSKWIEFLQVWVISMIFIGTTLLVLYFTPEFGNIISVSYLVVILISFLFYIASMIINRKLRLTK